MNLMAQILINVIIAFLAGSLLLGFHRKVMARVQLRPGPPIIQYLLHSLKFFFKETTFPKTASIPFYIGITVILAGMGGDNIVKILNKYPNKVKKLNRIIVDAHTDIPKVRKCIVNYGFEIEKEKILEKSRGFFLNYGDSKRVAESTVFLHYSIRIIKSQGRIKNLPAYRGLASLFQESICLRKGL